MRCEYCHHESHTQRTCSSYLIQTGRWNKAEWKALQQLEILEHDALRYGLQMRNMPEAVQALAVLGLKYD